MELQVLGASGLIATFYVQVFLKLTDAKLKWGTRIQELGRYDGISLRHFLLYTSTISESVS